MPACGDRCQRLTSAIGGGDVLPSIGRRQHPLQSRRPHGWISNRLDAAGQVRWTNDCNCRKLTFHSPSGRVTGIRQD